MEIDEEFKTFLSSYLLGDWIYLNILVNRKFGGGGGGEEIKVIWRKKMSYVKENM